MSCLQTAFYWFFVILFTGLSFKVNATAYYTVSSGSWESTGIWVNGQIPPLNGGDSIYIKHNVMYSSSITLTTATYLQIDSTGNLCGHRKFFVPSGSSMMNYGEVYADSLIINGGLVTNYNFMHMTNMAMVSAGGSLVNHGNMLIGNSFLCFEKANGLEEENEDDRARIYPLPVRNGEELQIKGLQEDCTIRIFTLAGKLAYEKKLVAGQGIFIAGLSAGIYIIDASRADKLLFRGKLIVAN